MTELRNPFIRVENGGAPSYGGNQMWSEKENMRVCGCGVIGSADLLLYLARYSSACPPGLLPGKLMRSVIAEKDYDGFTLALMRGYLPLIPRRGLNGLALAAGLELYFMRHAMPFRACWGARGTELFAAVEEQLRRDIPVILSIGPNFPRLWEKERLPLYVQTAEGIYRRTVSVKSHFLTVTGIDGEWLRVSSWGKLYYLSRAEFESYRALHSAGLFCSMVSIRQK